MDTADFISIHLNCSTYPGTSPISWILFKIHCFQEEKFKGLMQIEPKPKWLTVLPVLEAWAMCFVHHQAEVRSLCDMVLFELLINGLWLFARDSCSSVSIDQSAKSWCQWWSQRARESSEHTILDEGYDKDNTGDNASFDPPQKLVFQKLKTKTLTMLLTPTLMLLKINPIKLLRV